MDEMFDVLEFINKKPFLTGATLGIAVVGYLAFRAVQWILIKIGLIEKIDNAARKSFPEPAKANIDLKGKWWTVITESVDYKEFTQDWKGLADEGARAQTSSLIKQQYNKCSVDKSDPYFGTVFRVPANFSLWMKGVAFLASYLSAKKNIQGLFVCRNVDDISKKIEEVHNNPADQRIAIIAGSSCRLPQYPQHKLSVLIEKKEGQITIALLDPMPISGNDTADPLAILTDKSEFNHQERTFRPIVKTLIQQGIPAKLMHSSVHRETNGGCEIFALQDAIAFLKDPQFFNKIHLSPISTVIDENYKIYEIDLLPAEFLVGTQSLNALAEYKKRGIDFNGTLKGKNKSLQDCLKKYVITVRGKPQNHYITKKFYSYMYFLMRSLETLKEEDINEIANRSLI